MEDDNFRLEGLSFDERHYEADSNHLLHIHPILTHERSSGAWPDAAAISPLFGLIGDIFPR